MTISAFGFDVDSYNKPGFSFRQAYAAGYRVAMIKFGGMNLDGNAPYMMNGYHSFVDAALAAGFTTIVDYIVTGGSNPEAAARFWLANRHSAVVAHVVDNEKLDYGNTWNDGQACAYLDVIGSAADRWMYGSRDSLWNAGSWPGLAARRVKAHVAIYNGAPLTNCYPSTYPSELVLAHQYTSSATIGGVTLVDGDAFADGAFVKTKRTNGDEDMASHVQRQANGSTFELYKDLIIYDPGAKDQQIGNYLRGGEQPYGLNEADLLIALYRICGISQTLAPWPSGDTTATNILDSVLPGPTAQYTRQVFDASGTPSLIKYN